MSSHFITLEEVTKAFPGTVAVDSVSLSIDPGEIVGLVGKNGAGKSTLIKLLAGVERVDGGEIFIDGTAMSRTYAPSDAQHLGLAFVFQELEIIPELSASENIQLGNRFPRRAGIFVDWGRVHRKSAELLEELDIALDPRTPAKALRTAEQKLVMIARALHRESRLLVFDEPTAALTDQDKTHLFRIIRTLRERGCAIVYISHRLKEVMEITDRVVVMRDGGVCADSATTDLDMCGLIDAICGERAVSQGGRRPRASGSRPFESGGVEDGPPLLEVKDLEGPGLSLPTSVTVRGGEVVGIAGLVGSGRTELAKLVCGATRKSAGSLSVHGREIDVRSPGAALKEGIALLPEDRRHEGLILDFSIRENVTLANLQKYRRRRRVPVPSRQKERVAARAAMERLSIVSRSEEEKVGTLSGGNQQKTAVAKLLEAGPSIIVMDEATQGIDVHAKTDVFNIIDSLADAGKGIILISSDFEELAEHCDRVYVMSEGSIVGELKGENVREDMMVQLCYKSGVQGPE